MSLLMSHLQCSPPIVYELCAHLELLDSILLRQRRDDDAPGVRHGGSDDNPPAQQTNARWKQSARDTSLAVGLLFLAGCGLPIESCCGWCGGAE